MDSLLIGALMRHELFNAAVMPRGVSAPMISRYDVGMSYGAHVDSPLIGRGQQLRTDVSITLFLATPSEYDGGGSTRPSASARSSCRRGRPSAIPPECCTASPRSRAARAWSRSAGPKARSTTSNTAKPFSSSTPFSPRSKINLRKLRTLDCSKRRSTTSHGNGSRPNGRSPLKTPARYRDNAVGNRLTILFVVAAKCMRHCPALRASIRTFAQVVAAEHALAQCNSAFAPPPLCENSNWCSRE
jgi:hypothetical protein